MEDGGSTIASGKRFSAEKLLRESTAWWLWAVYAVAVGVSKYDLPPTPGHTFNIYREAALRWMEGEPLYNELGTRFLYFPTAAVCVIPFTLFPFAIGGVLWRLANLCVMALGTCWLARRTGGTREVSLFPLASLVALPLVWSAARYGNTTMALAGFLMLAASALVRERWWSAAVFLVLAVAIKPLGVVMVLLAVVLYPRVAWRTGALALATFLLPFATQSPDYVWQQYASVPQMFADAATWFDKRAFAETFWMLKTAGLEVPGALQTPIRLLVAAGVLALCWRQRRAGRGHAALFLYTMTVTYILLFGLRTERNAYALMAPALGIYTALCAARRQWRTVGLCAGLAVVYLLSHRFHSWFPDTLWDYLKPMVCIVFAVTLVRSEWRETAPGGSG